MEDTNEYQCLGDLPLWSDIDAKSVFEKICSKNGVDVDVIGELVLLHRERQHQERAHGIFLRIEEILGRMDENN
jgi:hypothetical protein